MAHFCISSRCTSTTYYYITHPLSGTSPSYLVNELGLDGKLVVVGIEAEDGGDVALDCTHRELGPGRVMWGRLRVHVCVCVYVGGCSRAQRCVCIDICAFFSYTYNIVHICTKAQSHASIPTWWLVAWGGPWVRLGGWVFETGCVAAWQPWPGVLRGCLQMHAPLVLHV